MSDHVIKQEETTDSRGTRYRVRLLPDPDAASPRTNDNVGVLCLSLPRYSLPMEDDDVGSAINGDYGLGGRRSFEAITRWLRRTRGARVVLPVWGYDHSMLSLHAGARSYPFRDPWNSGLAGIIFDSADTRRRLGMVGDHDVDSDRIAGWLAQEVGLYSKWGQGGYVGFVVEKWAAQCSCGECEGWQLVESCWGLDDDHRAWSDALEARDADGHFPPAR